MSKYSELSDLEINKLVAEFDNKGAATTESMPPPDYCKDPSAMWPIVWRNNISLIHMGNCYSSATTDAKKYIKRGVQVSSIEVMPFRAAAIVYLMMQEQQHDR